MGVVLLAITIAVNIVARVVANRSSATSGLRR